MSDEYTRVEAVSKLDLKTGDVLLVRVGGSLSSDQTWIPGPDELEVAAHEWGQVIPEGVVVLVSHHLVKPEIVTGVDNIKTLVIAPDGEKG